MDWFSDHLKSESKKAAVDRANTGQIIQQKRAGRKEAAIRKKMNEVNTKPNFSRMFANFGKEFRRETPENETPKFITNITSAICRNREGEICGETINPMAA